MDKCHPMVVAICLKLVQATTQGTLRQEDRNIKDTKKLKKFDIFGTR